MREAGRYSRQKTDRQPGCETDGLVSRIGDRQTGRKKS